MSTEKAPAPGMISELEALAKAQQAGQLPQHQQVPPAELIIHSSAVGMGVTPDDQVILMFTLPFGLRVTVPFSRDEWEQVRANSSRVSVAKQMPSAPVVPLRSKS